MTEKIIDYAVAFLDYWQIDIVGVICLASAVIVFIGFIKLILNKTGVYEKIPKLPRKIALGISSIALTLIGTLISCFIEEKGFDYYIVAAIFNSITTVIVYWLYEYTSLRDIIHFIGEKTLSLGNAIIAKIFTKGKIEKEDVELVKAEAEELKLEVRADIKKVINNDPTDLKNL